MFSAEDARKKSMQGMKETSERVIQLFEVIQYAADKGDRHCRFHQTITDDEEKQMVVLGYTIIWDRACSWYDIEW